MDSVPVRLARNEKKQKWVRDKLWEKFKITVSHNGYSDMVWGVNQSDNAKRIVWLSHKILDELEAERNDT